MIGDNKDLILTPIQEAEIELSVAMQELADARYEVEDLESKVSDAIEDRDAALRAFQTARDRVEFYLSSLLARRGDKKDGQ